MRITMLGTGTSHGVPTIDCMRQGYRNCPQQVCLKAVDNPRHRRTRSSILVVNDGHTLLIDTSQDFRTQMLATEVTHIDAVLYTHGHADHIYGLPDIRSYTWPGDPPLPIYGSSETLGALRETFQYVFSPPEYVGGGIPRLTPHLVEAPFELAGFPVVPIPVEHGNLQGCQGYRLGSVAYLPDVHHIGAASLQLLKGLDLLIINCLRSRPHSSHLSLEESLRYVELIAPRWALFTHMTHDIDYQLIDPSLPPQVRCAYDGQVIEL
ncbi:MAG: MBL fold metallo-hydrolase [Chloroflexi bacterium]|nr:MBL fold metallo-hydrolase [Chloroflexota bacterium]